MKYLARVVLVVLAAASIMLGQWGAAFGQTQAGGASGLSFDHTTTGYFLDNAHRLVGCESCHTSGVFRGTPRTCATCHAGAGARAPGKPATHIPTTAACDACHRPGATNWTERPTGFTQGGTGHPINPLLGVTATNCQTCHNGAFLGANALTKPVTHVQTTAPCSSCHGTTAWLPATGFHVGVVPGSCANCHNGVKAPGKKADHIPTTAACDTCHNNFNAFSPAQMNHAGLDGQCATCHSGRYSSQNALGKQAAHISTALQCDNCHHSTTSWVTTFDHTNPPITQACAACHDGASVALGKPVKHVPTNAACDTCHSGFVSFKPAQMNHAGTTGQCSTCHSGAYVAANAQTMSGRHLPTSMQCDTCHTQGFVAWTPAVMNHNGQGGMCSSCHSGGYLAQNAQTKPASHVSTSAQCDSCHSSTTTWATGVFNHAGATPAVAGRCSTCHNGQPNQGLGKPTNHVPTTAQCDTCHKTFATFASVAMNHTGTAGTCSSCHNGGFLFANALARPAVHIPSNAQCDACHTGGFAAWSPAVMDHSLADVKSQACSTCHSGTYVSANAQVKPATHVSTAAECSNCHKSTTSWATRSFDHASVPVNIGSGTCANSCHNGSPDKGLAKPSTHIPTTAACDTCHTNFTAFRPARMDHSLADVKALACSTCHGGAYVSQNALAKPTNHVSTTEACNTCHTGTTSWLGAAYAHASPPGVCATCHNGATALGKSSSHIPTSTACDTCHKNQVSFKPAQMDHSLEGTTCSNCHGGSYISINALAKPASHVPVTDQCVACHKTGFVSWSPAAMDHEQASVKAQACATCHGGAYTSQNAQTKPTTHQATNAACSDCHKSTTSWATATQDHSKLTPPVSIGDHTCNSCHNGTKDKGLAKPGTHIPTTGFCDTCHKGFATFAPASMDHTGTVGQCSTCHGGGYTAVNAQVKSATHLSTTAQCDVCHSSTTVWASVAFAHDATAYGKCSTCHDGSKALGISAGHIPTGTQQCSDCHKNFVSFKPAQMNHVLTVGLCSTCHNATYAGKNALPMPTAHIKVTEQCDTCHKSGYVAWSPATMDHTQPSVTAQTCATCHSGGYLSQNAQQKPATHQSTSAACSDCHKTTTTWATATQDHSKLSPPVTIGDHTCSTSCHNGTANKGLAKPSTHIPTAGACDTCHASFTAFAPAAMNHSGTAGACVTCHGGNYTALNAQVKTAKHIPTTQSCDVCHATTAWKPTSYSHQGVTAGSCATCHNGTNALGKSTSHIPTTAACDSCHKNYTAFSPAQMNHTGTAGTCATCHSGTYLSVNAQIKPSTHVATSAQCDTCHSSTTSWATATYVHAATATGTCDTCHGKTALGKPTNHVPTSAQCDTCHGNFTAFKPAQMNHTATDGKCSWCHGGNYVFANALAKSSAHVPVSDQCDKCHKNGFVSWSPATMDHNLVVAQACSTCHGGSYVSQNAQTKPVTHQSTTAPCSDCHKTTTTWATATQDHSKLSPAVTIGDHTCNSCHNGTAGKGLAKPTTHIPTSAACDTCHTNFTAFAPAAMNHSGTAGACASCHGGGYTALNAQAKTSTHITTTQSCDTCHGTTAWKPASYSHSGVTAGSCATCHNGTNALGKSTSHIPTAAACDTCHKNYVAFTPAQMNHTGLTGQCSTCHGGGYLAVNAQTKSATHVTTTAQCDTCHSSTTSWATATFVHAKPPGVCSSCHDGVKALGKPSTHIPTTATCDTCHKNQTAFKPATMDHTGLSGQCTTCHSGAYVTVNALAKPSTHIPVSAQCDTCHTKGFASWSPAVMLHTTAMLGQCTTCHSGAYLSQNAQVKPSNHSPTTAQCDTCHKSTNSWSTNLSYTHASNITIGGGGCTTCHGVSALGKSTNHVPTSGQCDTCHNNFTAFAPAAMNHTGTSNACATCHGGAYTTLNAQAKPSTHIATTQSCDVCHGTTAWKPTSFAHQGVTAGSCANCHNGTNALGKNLTHIPTALSCDTCHKTTDASFAPANKMTHTSAMTGQCSTCHNGSYVGVNALAKPTTHVTTTAQCDTCHASTSTWTTGTYTHPVTATGTCSNCHNGSVLGASGKSATHISTTAQCDTCHKSYTTWLGATYTHAASATGTCSTCHNGTVALGKPTGTGHIPTNMQCDTCHKNYSAFKPANMSHTGTTGQCLTCHNGGYTGVGTQGAQVKSLSHIATTDSCDACHLTTAWTPTSFAHTSAQVGTKKCADCHNGTQATGKPALHIPTQTSESCGVCHRTGVAWLPLITPYSHTSVTAACSTCHVISYPGMDYKPSNHVPTTATCDTCHIKTNWTTTSFAHTGAVTCQTCHTGTYLGVIGKSTNHIPTTLSGLMGNECSNCHKRTTVGGFTTDTMNHGSIQTGCKTCHNSPAVYATGSARLIKIGSHQGSKAADDCSQSGCHKPLGKKGSPYSSWD